MTVLEREHSSALTNKVILREFTQAAHTSQKTNCKVMQRNAVITENGESKEEREKAGCEEVETCCQGSGGQQRQLNHSD